MNAPQIIENEATVTEVVKASFERTENPRLKEIMNAFVEHAHALVREVNLSEEEFHYGLRFIAAIGQANTDKHNEAVLAADVLGISTLVSLRNNPTDHGQTAAALLGPFWRLYAPECECGDSIARSTTPGETLIVSGQVRDTTGQPVSGAVLDVWQASPIGLYENQDPEQVEMNLRGKFRADEDGRFHFSTIRPAGYPVPTHGPIGQLLKAQNRHPYRPAHIHFMISAPGHKTLITQVFLDAPERLASDVVFGVTKTLVGNLQRHDHFAPMPPGATLPVYTLEYNFVIEEGEPVFPEPPIK
jgi:protocatechuate 3,4-dioxygenase beta subunit